MGINIDTLKVQKLAKTELLQFGFDDPFKNTALEIPES